MVFETERMRLPLAANGRATRRAALFRESLPDMAERWALGFAWALSPKRINGAFASMNSSRRTTRSLIPTAPPMNHRGLPELSTT